MSYAPLGYYGLGRGQQETAVAGPVNGVATLRRDVQASARNAAQAYGANLTYDGQAFRALLRRFKDNPDEMEGQRLQPGQVRNFVVGVVVETAAAVARAEQLASLRVVGPLQRSENHRGQAELIGAARIMLDGCNQFLRTVAPVREGVSGSGLGEPISLSVIVAIAVVAVIVGVAAVVVGALVADAMNRMIQARATAQRICREAEGGCTAEEYSAIVAQLQLGPFDSLARGGATALASAGTGVATTLVIAGAGALALGGLWFLFGTQAGRRTLEGLRTARKKETAS